MVIATMVLAAMRPMLAEPAAAETMKSATLGRFVWPADPRIAPDGERIVFVRVNVDEANDRYTANLWLCDANSGDIRQLTFGGLDTSPRWSPDGTVLAFLRVQERRTKDERTGDAKDGSKNRPQVFVLPMNGGDARRLTDLKAGVSAIDCWSPDNRRIVFSTTQATPQPGDSDSDDVSEKKSKAVVVTRPVFRSDGKPGLLDPDKHRHLWAVSLATALPAPLTTGAFDETDAVYSSDGETILFTSDRRLEPWFGPRDRDVYAIPHTGGTPVKIVDIEGPLSSPAVASSGGTMATLGHKNAKPMRSYDQRDLLVHRHGVTRNVTQHFDFPLGNHIGADAHPPIAGGGERLRFVGQGSAVVTQVSRRGRCALTEIDLQTAAVTDLVAGDFEVVSWSMTPGGDRFALLIASPTDIGEVHLFDRNRGLRQLTHIQREAVGDIELSHPEEFRFESFDGREIHGWLLKPPGFDPGRKYPLILEIHGGPHMAYGYGFYQEFHVLAARGFCVLYVNPRGSATYGQEFGNIIQYAYPGNDYHDLMAAVDHVVARGFVDQKRLGVTGGSGGGLLTNWIITQTDRFAAAVTQRCVSDWVGFYYTADFSLYTPFWFRGQPFEDMTEYLRRSPLTFVQRITTPLLIVHSELDYRTPIAQGEAMFRALLAQRKPVAMVRFPGESHDLSRNGKPAHRIERLDHIVNWFEMFLNGRSTNDYGDKLRTLAEKRRAASEAASTR